MEEIQFNKDTALVDIIGVALDHDKWKIIRLTFIFIGREYNLFVKDINVKDDIPDFNSIEGPSDLFDSFESLCEDDLWPFIKNQVNTYITQQTDE